MQRSVRKPPYWLCYPSFPISESDHPRIAMRLSIPSVTKLHPAPVGIGSRKGSVLVISLLLAVLGTLGVAAWISLLDARSRQADTTVTALTRRTTLQNSRALAHGAISTHYLASASGLANNTAYALNNSLGSATISSYTQIPLTTTASQRSSITGATPTQSYSVDTAVSVQDGIGSTASQAQLRSIHPALVGDLLVMLPPVDFNNTSPLVSGSFKVRGRAIFWDAITTDLNSGIRADQYLLPDNILGTVTLQNIAGSNVLPLNYPIPRQTTGTISGGTPYQGAMDMFHATRNAHNSYRVKVTAASPNRTVSGTTRMAEGLGASTVANKSGDSSRRDQITWAAAGDSRGANVYTNLTSAIPLSSSVLLHLFNNPNALNNTQHYTLLNGHASLPDDVLAKLVDPTLTFLTDTQKTALLDKSAVWVHSNGVGKVIINVANTALEHLLLERVALLELHGATTAAADAALATLAPRAIVVANPSGFGLQDVLLNHRCARRLILAISTEPITGTPAYTYWPTLRCTGNFIFPNWHIIMDLQNTGFRINTAVVSEAVIYGGIRANRSLTVTGGAVTLRQETNQAGYEPLLTRSAWIESARP